MKVVTGNQLDDGAVVYLGLDDRWVQTLHAAAQFSDEDAKNALIAAKSRVKEIADVYLVDVDAEGGFAGRETLRESIRKAGPTVRSDLGYQASAQP